MSTLRALLDTSSSVRFLALVLGTTLVYLGVFHLLTQAMPYVWALGICFSAQLIWKFIASRGWVFKSQKTPGTKFVLYACLDLLISFWLTKLGMDYLIAHWQVMPVIANATTSAALFPFALVGTKLIFAPPKMLSERISE